MKLCQLRELLKKADPTGEVRIWGTESGNGWFMTVTSKTPNRNPHLPDDTHVVTVEGVNLPVNPIQEVANFDPPKDNPKKPMTISPYDPLLVKVKRIVGDRMSHSTHDMTEHTHLMEDLRADSLDLAELIMDFEDSFGAHFDEDILDVRTIGGVVEALRKRGYK